ncbi:hypothetical protein BV25DRAFT_352597 [Artomyces pyxidatus]|uniref:Uncharacterized protein n=1 Tax=Artomyces pyxidatus TaxID=48021 RepID=A0ACB8SEP1_9AGAM|nr:hypothetical protein BV25DRAFT_352597 [Artomyces pyxidatus]
MQLVCTGEPMKPPPSCFLATMLLHLSLKAGETTQYWVSSLPHGAPTKFTDFQRPPRPGTSSDRSNSQRTASWEVKWQFRARRRSLDAKIVAQRRVGHDFLGISPGISCLSSTLAHLVAPASLYLRRGAVSTHRPNGSAVRSFSSN